MRDPPPPLSPDVALFLDFDGTLVDIAATPEAVIAPADLGEILQDTAWGLNGALAIVSGRQISVIDSHIDASVAAVGGISGAERRTAAGQVHRIVFDRAVLDHARSVLGGLARDHSGVRLEDKGISLALHYRLAPALAEACHAVVAGCAAKSLGRLEKISSNMVVELQPIGVSKAVCVRAYMNEPPFAGRRPVFVGDDPVDEDAFAEVNRTNGYSVIVGDRMNTAATHRLRGVRALHDWLRTFSAGQLRGDPIAVPRSAMRPRQQNSVS